MGLKKFVNYLRYRSFKVFFKNRAIYLSFLLKLFKDLVQMGYNYMLNMRL